MKNLNAIRRNSFEDVDIPDEILDLIPDFLERRMSELKFIDDKIAVQDSEEIFKLGHDLRGIGTSYGFPKISKFGEEFELSSSEKDFERLKDLSKAYKDYVVLLSENRKEFL